MSHYCSYSKEEKSNSRTKLFFLTLFSAYFYGGRRKIQSLIKVKHFSTWSQYIYTPNQVGNFISDIKYSITLNETTLSPGAWKQGVTLPTLPWVDSLNISQEESWNSNFPKNTSTVQGLLLMWRLRRTGREGKEKGSFLKGKLLNSRRDLIIQQFNLC